jgi:hypothetical protein
MKKIIIFQILLAMTLLSLGGCFWGVGYYHDRDDGYYYRDGYYHERGERHEHHERYEDRDRDGGHEIEHH